MKNKLLVLFFLIINGSESKAGFDYTPVLIHLNSAHQNDSIGFNLIDALPQIIYKRLLSGELSLWDSPKKETRIGLESLQAIEQSTGTSFLEIQDLFINEMWRHYKHQFEFNIIGFTFINSSSSGQKVVYGFVDVQEIKEMLQTLIIPTNANGPNNLTFWDALYSKNYPFNIVQFGKENFEKNPHRSLEMKKTYFVNTKFNTNQIKLPLSKEISYFILATSFNRQNKLLFDELNGYFNLNKQDFFNIGGSEIVSYLDKSKVISISKITVEAIITKTNGYNERKIKQVVFYSDGKALSPLTGDQINSLSMLIDFKSLKEFLEGQSYQFTLTKINHQLVPGGYSGQYIEALNGNNWNKITMSTEK
jgi:hypothetical protein